MSDLAFGHRPAERPGYVLLAGQVGEALWPVATVEGEIRRRGGHCP